RRLDHRDVVFIVNAPELLARRDGRLVVLDVLVDATGDKPVGNGVEPVGALRMVASHVVLPADRMSDEGGGHGGDPRMHLFSTEDFRRRRAVERSVARRRRW